MSTRGVCGFRCDGQLKVSYNHSDSYPSELGNKVLRALRGMLAEWDPEELFGQVRALRLVDSDACPTGAELAACFERIDLCGWNWYDMLRALQGDLRGSLRVGLACDDAAYFKDSAFCEWAYVVNCDTEELEVYHNAELAASYPWRALPDAFTDAQFEEAV